MRFRIGVLGLVAALLVAGCGGSGHATSSAAPPASISATTAVPAATQATTSRPAAQSTTSSSYSAVTPATTAPAATHARVPVTFVIEPGGLVTPSTVLVPASVPIQLTIVSADGKPHRALVQGSFLIIPAGGRRTVLLHGLKAGRYPLTIDEVTQVTIVVGAQPGP